MIICVNNFSTDEYSETLDLCVNTTNQFLTKSGVVYVKPESSVTLYCAAIVPTSASAVVWTSINFTGTVFIGDSIEPVSRLGGTVVFDHIDMFGDCLNTSVYISNISMVPNLQLMCQSTASIIISLTGKSKYESKFKLQCSLATLLN